MAQWAVNRVKPQDKTSATTNMTLQFTKMEKATSLGQLPYNLVDCIFDRVFVGTNEEDVLPGLNQNQMTKAAKTAKQHKK